MPGISPSGEPARQQTEGRILSLRGCWPKPPPKRHRLKVPSVVNPRPPSLRISEPRDGSCPSALPCGRTTQFSAGLHCQARNQRRTELVRGYFSVWSVIWEDIEF
jgi:hypothetical protein